MPNWTRVGLTVENTGRGYQDLLEIFTPDDLGKNALFEKFIPMPSGKWSGTLEEWEKLVSEKKGAELEAQLLIWEAQNLAKFGFRHPNDWCHANWGTKWDVCHFILHRADEQSFFVTFDTANGFPEPILKKMVQRFPEIHFFGSGLEEFLHYAVNFVYRPDNLDGLICRFNKPARL